MLQKLIGELYIELRYKTSKEGIAENAQRKLFKEFEGVRMCLVVIVGFNVQIFGARVSKIARKKITKKKQKTVILRSTACTALRRQK